MNKEIETEIQKLKLEYNYTINDIDDVQRITNDLKLAKVLITKIKEELDPDIDKAHKLHKSLVEKRKKYIEPVEFFVDKCGQSILAYNRQVEKEQREREADANKRLAEAAEQQKQELLNKSKESVNEWESEVLKEKAQGIKPMVLEPQKKVLEVQGLGIRKTWKSRIIDINKVPREYMLINQEMLDKAAKIEGVRLTGIEGIEFYQDESMSIRR